MNLFNTQFCLQVRHEGGHATASTIAFSSLLKARVTIMATRATAKKGALRMPTFVKKTLLLLFRHVFFLKGTVPTHGRFF